LFEVQPYNLSKEASAMQKVAIWLKQEKLIERKIFCSHTWLIYFLDIDGYQCLKLDYNNIDSADSGSILVILVWDKHYGDRSREEKDQ
jgi:hypothetical protein